MLQDQTRGEQMKDYENKQQTEYLYVCISCSHTIACAWIML